MSRGRFYKPEIRICTDGVILAVGTHFTKRYSEFFKRVTGESPYKYQIQLAEELFAGHNIALRVPTGCGKTWAALVPLFYDEWSCRPARLIYVLPLRTLAQSIYNKASWLGRRVWNEIVVTLQTGEEPGDPFLDRGKIIVTTYDQLLSSLLCAPYGLSDRQGNVNAAAVAGSLVVFDEFHLMESQRAFLTAVATMRLFRGLTQSLWMTATGTEPLTEILAEAMDVRRVPCTQDEYREVLKEVPAINSVSKRLIVERSCLSADSVLKVHDKRTIVVCNQVGRAQELFQQLKAKTGLSHVFLLHSRFFKADRTKKEEEITKHFGRHGDGGILVATQVIEVGLDISCEHLHTEICPINSLVQRAGRCARFEGETGTVHVYPLNDVGMAHLPYEASEIQIAQEVIGPKETRITPDVCGSWVEKAHGESDRMALRTGWRARFEDCLRRIQSNSFGGQRVRVTDLIREVDNVRIVIAPAPPDSPEKLDGIAIPRDTLRGLVQRYHGSFPGWVYDTEGVWQSITSPRDINRGYVLCLSPAVATYGSELGLRLGQHGEVVSPARMVPERPGWKATKGELWQFHAEQVAAEALARLEREGRDGGLLGCGLKSRYGLDWNAVKATIKAVSLLHDLGKLQEGWQAWAHKVMKSTNLCVDCSRALAHTNPDSGKTIDENANRYPSRPPHAAAGAYYAPLILPQLLGSLLSDRLLQKVSASCMAAILSHHGGWLPDELGARVGPLWNGAANELRLATGYAPCERSLKRLWEHADKKGLLHRVLQEVVAPDNVREWWPWVAYLIRTVRLSDQQATAEGGVDLDD